MTAPSKRETDRRRRANLRRADDLVGRGGVMAGWREEVVASIAKALDAAERRGEARARRAMHDAERCSFTAGYHRGVKEARDGTAFQNGTKWEST